MMRRWLTQRAIALIAFLALAGCGPVSGGGPDVAGPLEGGDFRAAAAGLRKQAARCESGERGREAVLVWAMLELDLRNPAGSPDTAARLTARYLQLPDAKPAGISAAESLYLLALDRGASTVEDPWAFSAVAPRYGRCGHPSPEPVLVRELPAHPGTPSMREINEVHKALHLSRKQADSLRTELERIRKLLQQSSGTRQDRP